MYLNVAPNRLFLKICLFYPSDHTPPLINQSVDTRLQESCYICVSVSLSVCQSICACVFCSEKTFSVYYQNELLIKRAGFFDKDNLRLTVVV